MAMTAQIPELLFQKLECRLKWLEYCFKSRNIVSRLFFSALPEL
jgi:hypothetical protein